MNAEKKKKKKLIQTRQEEEKKQRASTFDKRPRQTEVPLERMFDDAQEMTCPT